MPSRLRLLSYNIHAGIGTDNVSDPKRIAKVVAGVEADVVALQEVRRDFENPEQDMLRLVQEHTGLKRSLFAPTIDWPDGDFGNALLLSLPCLETDAVTLAVPGKEPRNLLRVTTNHQGQRLHIICVHLGLGLGEREVQVRRLIAYVQSLPKADGVLILGDFNEYYGYSRSLRQLFDSFDGGEGMRTFPSAWPVLRLDRLWHLGEGIASKPQPVVSSLTRVASDHLPLRIECVWANEKAPSEGALDREGMETTGA